jgi:hypothetical protein
MAFIKKLLTCFTISVCLFQFCLSPAAAENLKLKNGKSYNIRQYKLLPKEQIQITDDKGQDQNIPIAAIDVLVTPKDWLPYLGSGAVIGAYAGVIILGVTQLTVMAFTKSNIAVDPSAYVLIGATGAVVGLGVGSVIALIADDDLNHFSKLTPAEQLTLLKRHELVTLTSRTASVDRPARWNVSLHNYFPGQISFKNINGFDYEYAASNELNLGIEYEKPIDETWSWSLGFSGGTRLIDEERVLLGTQLNSQTTYDINFIKPQISTSRIATRFYKQLTPQTQVFFGMQWVRYQFSGSTSLFTFLSTPGGWGYELGIAHYLYPKLALVLNAVANPGFEVLDARTQQKTSQTSLTVWGLSLKYTL